MTPPTTYDIAQSWQNVGYDLLDAINKFMYQVGEAAYVRTWDGSLPPPEILKDIDVRYPGANAIILKMTEVVQNRRHERERHNL